MVERRGGGGRCRGREEESPEDWNHATDQRDGNHQDGTDYRVLSAVRGQTDGLLPVTKDGSQDAETRLSGSPLLADEREALAMEVGDRSMSQRDSVPIGRSQISGCWDLTWTCLSCG